MLFGMTIPTFRLTIVALAVMAQLYLFFRFMRIGAPVLGPAWLIQFRVGIAALFLLICAVWLRKWI